MKKVLHCRSSAGFAGPERHIAQLAQSLPTHGFDVGLNVLYRPAAGVPAAHPLVAQAIQAGLDARQIEDTTKFSFHTISHIRRQLEQDQYHLVHTHDYKTNLLAGIAARWADVPTVATVHLHTRTTWRLRVYRLLDLVVLRFFPKIIAVSDRLRQELITAGLPEQRIVTIHNAIDVEAIQNVGSNAIVAWRRRLGIQPNQSVVTLVGRLSPQKGPDTFLESAAHIARTFPETKFLIVGEGPLRRRLERIAATLGLREQVYFLGYQAEVLPLLALSDVVALPSLNEGLPYVLLEALALARPVVATPVGGIPEVIANGQTGLIVPVRAPDALAAAVCRLLKHPDEARRLGEAGRVRVMQAFSLPVMISQIVEAYHDVLSST